VRPLRWTVRRRRLESLAGRWVPPLRLSPVTAQVDEAREWLDAFKSSGVEGLVMKGASTRYQPGRRDWVKVKHRVTVDAIVGAVTEPASPEVLVVGRYRGKVLDVVGRTVKLQDDQAAEIGKLSHRQIHLRANGKEACVDQGLAGLMAKLWAVCDTRSCCEDENGRAYVVPTAGTREAAEQFLTSLGIPFDLERGILYFRLPRGHAGDFSPPGAGQGEVIRWRVDESGKFVRIR